MLELNFIIYSLEPIWVGQWGGWNDERGAQANIWIRLMENVYSKIETKQWPRNSSTKKNSRVKGVLEQKSWARRWREVAQSL